MICTNAIWTADGVHYDTEHAVIRINGEPAAEADLKVGYHVRFRADGGTHEAWSVDYYDTIAGALESVRVTDAEMQRAELVILGQPVTIDADTWLHGVLLDALETGMRLAVSADRQPDGGLVATAVEAVARAVDVLSGPITAIDGLRLTIGGITVDASVIGIAPGGVGLAVGDWVHALGHYDGSGVLYADRFVRDGDAGVEPMPAVIEGTLRRQAGAWWIRDHAIEVAAGESSGLIPGARATVRGVLLPSGRVRASTVRTDRRHFERLDGDIEAMDGDDGAILVNGTRVIFDEGTSYRDDRDGYRWLGPDSLGVHDSVSLIVEEMDGVLVARKITRRAEASRLIRGRVQRADFWQGPEVLSRRQADVYRAQSAFYDGRRIGAWQLRFLMREGDAVTLRFDARGRVSRADVQSARD